MIDILIGLYFVVLALAFIGFPCLWLRFVWWLVFTPITPERPQTEADGRTIEARFEVITPEPHPPISVHVDPGEAPTELITEVFLAFSAMHMAEGGSRLRIIDRSQPIPQAQEIPEDGQPYRESAP